MWVRNTQTNDDGEPHPRELKLADTDGIARFDDEGRAEVSDRDGDMLVEQMSFVEPLPDADIPDEGTAEAGTTAATEAEGDPTGTTAGPDEGLSDTAPPDDEPHEGGAVDPDTDDEFVDTADEPPETDDGEDTPDDVLDMTTDDEYEEDDDRETDGGGLLDL